MNLDTNIAPALLAALEHAGEQGGAAAALAAAGICMPDAKLLEGFPADFGEVVGRSVDDPAVREAVALGYLAGRLAHRPRTRTLHDVTAFVMDRELVVKGARGESILRLPWFHEDLFVGRPVPDISEMPAIVRDMCTENYLAALNGERRRFSFTSYGHSYAVDAVPVHGEAGGIATVLAVARPAPSFAAAATAYERLAERLEHTAEMAEQRAECHRLAGRRRDQLAELDRAKKARAAAERAMENTRQLHSRVCPADAPSLTQRETEVLALVSHGLTYAETAEQLDVASSTIKTHMANIYSKLGVTDKAAAVGFGLRHGIIQ
jgi:DNA-binding CsgD family transcriptional regulator